MTIERNKIKRFSIQIFFEDNKIAQQVNDNSKHSKYSPLSNGGAVDRVDFELRFLLSLVLPPPLLPLAAVLLVLLLLLCVPVDVV